jgi:hypothetical protein
MKQLRHHVYADAAGTAAHLLQGGLGAVGQVRLLGMARHL